LRECARRKVVEHFDLKRVCMPQRLKLPGIKEKIKTIA